MACLALSSQLCFSRKAGRETDVYAGVEVNDAVLDDLLQLGLGHAERGVHFVEREEEVGSADLHRVEVVRDARDGPHLARQERRSARRSERNGLLLPEG